MKPEQNTHWEVDAPTEAEAIERAKANAIADGLIIVRVGQALRTHDHWHVTLLTRRA